MSNPCDQSKRGRGVDPNFAASVEVPGSTSCKLGTRELEWEEEEAGIWQINLSVVAVAKFGSFFAGHFMGEKG